jgi:Ca2+-transporting ATPase
MSSSTPKLSPASVLSPLHNHPDQPPADRWHGATVEQVTSWLETDVKKGLTAERVFKQQQEQGSNIIQAGKENGLLDKFWREIKNPLVVILLAAGVGTVMLGEYVDALVIAVAVAINVVIGVFQEERASRAFAKLNASQEKMASVVRDGHRSSILAAELVPGDLIILEAGMAVPADVRLVEASELEINEAALTGEWVDVNKSADVLPGDVVLAERSNMAWMGTLVVSGQGKGIVIATGADTQIGQVAKSLSIATDVETPIQKSIAHLARVLSIASLAVVLVIVVLGLWRGQSFTDILLIGIAIAVSAVPEGLPAAVTVVLAIGMEKILARGGLVRNLLAAETLGSTTVIMTDKTGTLTQGKMSLRELVALESARHEDQEEEAEHEVLKAAVLASDAYVEEVEEIEKTDSLDGTSEGVATEVALVVHGRPIERAIVQAGLAAGLSQMVLAHDERQLDFLPFTSEQRFAASLNRKPEGGNRVYLSGAPEFLLEQSDHIYYRGAVVSLTPEYRENILAAQTERSARGERLIAVAFKDTSLENIASDDKATIKSISTGLVFGGLLVFEDPLRPDVPQAIHLAKGAGAHVLVVTGDNSATALAIAQQARIVNDHAQALTGPELDSLSDEELARALKRYQVFARVLPSQKLRIAGILRSQGEVVAMTGDGINDAPALRSADIGVAVGSGTDVAKEAADLVLLDNSFSIIVAAIEEGRRIIDNLKKIVVHLVATGFGEIFLLVGTLALAAPIPILPAQILWVNIVQGGLLTFAFAFEPARPGIMTRNPRSAELSGILTPSVKRLILTAGIVTGFFTLLLFSALYFWLHLPLADIRTMMFVTLAFDALFFTFSLKNFYRPLWQLDLFSNKFLLAAFGVSALMLTLSFTIPPLRQMLALVMLSPLEVVIMAGVGLFNIITIECSKYFAFERRA